MQSNIIDKMISGEKHKLSQIKRKKNWYLPAGCELTLAGDSLAVEGATICVWPVATVLFCCGTLEFCCCCCCGVLCCCCCACCCCCCCWVCCCTTWLFCWLWFCNVGGLCPPVPFVSSYMAALVCDVCDGCPHQAPAAACDPAVTSWGS